MAVWPEERLREHVEAAGGRARIDAGALLHAFSVRQPTERAGENVRRWLEGVGVTMEPPVLPHDGEVTLWVAAAGTPGSADDIAPAEVRQRLRASVVAYCSRVCEPDRIVDAADAAFAAFEARVAAEGDGRPIDLDTALLEATREAAAERTAAAAPLTRTARLASRRLGETCNLMPKLLAGRASDGLGDTDRRAVVRHLARCPSCRALERRRAEAERAYAALLHEPAPEPEGATAAPDPEPAAVAEPPEPQQQAEPQQQPEPEQPPAPQHSPDPPEPPAAVERPAAAAPPPPQPPDGAPPPDNRSAWTRRIAITVFLIGTLLTVDAVLTVTWKEPLSAFLQARQQDKLEDELAQEQEKPVAISAREEAAISDIKSEPERRERRLSAYARSFARQARTGHAVGRLRVEGLGEWVVVQGTNDADLRKAPGHYSETVMPGERGTVAVAGHRTTYGAPFRHVDKLKRGDSITFTMPYGRFTYRVQGHKIVPAGSSDATRRVSYNRIVLTACHPLHSSSQRILVFGRLEEKEPLGRAAEDSASPAGATPAERRAAARRRTRARLKTLGRRLLGPGTKGKDVKALQRLLGVPQTGTYDALTEFAVRAFQQKHKLGADGRAGAATKRKLARRPRPPTTPPTPPAVAPVPPKDADGDGRPDRPGTPGPNGQRPGAAAPYPTPNGQQAQGGGSYVPRAGPGR